MNRLVVQKSELVSANHALRNEPGRLGHGHDLDLGLANYAACDR